MNRRWTVLIGIVVSAVFLYFAARGARVDLMVDSLRAANYWLMIPCVAATLLAFWIRALRWKVLLQPLRRIPQGVVFSATMIGFLANNVLPARLGELVRAHVVGRRAQVSRSAALASILVERIFDLFTVLGLFAVVALVSEFPGGLEKVALVVLVIGLITLLLLLLWYRQPDRFLRVALLLVPRRFRATAEDLAHRFRDGLRVFDSAGQLLIVGLFSVLMWGLILLVVGLSIIALGIDAPQPQAAMVALVAIALVTMVPSAPGFIGTLQGGGTAAMLVFGVPKEQGLAFTIVFHATQWIPVNAVGLYYLFREGLSFGQLSRIARPGEVPADREEKPPGSGQGDKPDDA